jgi:hypothetical protein
VKYRSEDRGDFTTDRITEAKKFYAKGWGDQVGELTKEDKEIAWANGSTWKRAR